MKFFIKIQLLSKYWRVGMWTIHAFLNLKVRSIFRYILRYLWSSLIYDKMRNMSKMYNGIAN